MNVATEYVMRNNVAAKMLKLPCSLFLESLSKRKKKMTKSALVLETDGADFVTVTRYDLTQQKSKSVPEPSYKTQVNRADIFTSPFIVIPNMFLMPFHETPYTFDGKQEQSIPLSVIQEKEYTKTVDGFFQSMNNKTARETWLWRVFEKINISPETRTLYAESGFAEATALSRFDAALHQIWVQWKSTLLDFSGPASELIFNKVYKGKINAYPERLVRSGMDEFMPVMRPSRQRERIIFPPLGMRPPSRTIRE
jgi:hypothetical protein